MRLMRRSSKRATNPALIFKRAPGRLSSELRRGCLRFATRREADDKRDHSNPDVEPSVSRVVADQAEQHAVADNEAEDCDQPINNAKDFEEGF
jgi:hypothetical protein